MDCLCVHGRPVSAVMRETCERHSVYLILEPKDMFEKPAICTAVECAARIHAVCRNARQDGHTDCHGNNNHACTTAWKKRRMAHMGKA